MKEFLIGTLIGFAISVYGLWRLEIKHMGSGGCLLPFTFVVLVMLIGAFLLT